jgi:hypothetical protein
MRRSRGDSKQTFVANPKIRIVWGENCTDVRHLDCISFIN